MKNTNRKSIDNFHKFTERLFSRLFTEYVQRGKASMEVEEESKKKVSVSINVEYVMGLFHTFLLFFCQGLDTQRI